MCNVSTAILKYANGRLVIIPKASISDGAGDAGLSANYHVVMFRLALTQLFLILGNIPEDNNLKTIEIRMTVEEYKRRCWVQIRPNSLKRITWAGIASAFNSKWFASVNSVIFRVKGLRTTWERVVVKGKMKHWLGEFESCSRTMTFDVS